MEVVESIRECPIAVISLQGWFVVSDGEDALPYTLGVTCVTEVMLYFQCISAFCFPLETNWLWLT